MSARDDLLAAIDAGDHIHVRQGLFGPVWESLATSNAPRQGCTLNELKPYVRFLGHIDPELVLDALEACAGEFRPTPGELRGWINRKRGEHGRVDLGRGRALPSTDAALEAVRIATDEGETECSCNVAPTLVRWRCSTQGVLRCPDCGGLEPGQAYYATEPDACDEGDTVDLPENVVKLKTIGGGA